MSIDPESPFDQYPWVTFMAQKGMPVNASGVTKQVDVVETRMDKIWKAMNPGTTESAYYIADHWVIPGKRFLDTVDLYRYKDALEGRFPNKGTGIFDRLMWNVMQTMSKKKDVYYFGGVSDKERAVFLHHHPRTALKEEKMLLNEQFMDLKNVFGKKYFLKNNLYDVAEKAFITKYAGGKPSPEARDLLKEYLGD